MSVPALAAGTLDLMIAMLLDGASRKLAQIDKGRGPAATVRFVPFP
jgi:hypothetical protein